MKKTIGILVCILMLSTLCACGANDDASLQSSNESSLQTSDESSLQDGGEISLQNGNYYAEGDYDEMLNPLIHIDPENNRFSYSGGIVVSAAFNGTYEIVGDKLVATRYNETVEFEIIDAKTLVLTKKADWIALPVGTRYVFSTETK